MFDMACAWRRKTLQPPHPDRVRCEAYVLLASASFTPNEIANALLQQRQQFVRGRADSTALAASLSTAAAWAVGGAAPHRSAAEFPILP